MARARGYAPLVTSPAQDALLDRIVAHAGARPGALGVFDLDGCLFDTRPRQVQIYRQLASQRSWWELYQIREDHILDWSLANTMRRAGISEARAAELEPQAKPFFYDHFFRPDYMLHDHAMPGAAALVWRCYQAGLGVVYLTGRHEEMRAGTEEALVRYGFPYRRQATTLLVKPTAAMTDLDFKAEALRELHLLGRPVLFLDNEPANCNHFYQAHPEALVVWVETDHSPRPDEPHPDLPALRGFLYQS